MNRLGKFFLSVTATAVIMTSIVMTCIRFFLFVTIFGFCYRIEYDAYRMDLENSKPEPISPASNEEAQKSYAKHKESYEKLRADIAVKMQFLDENRVG